MADEKTFPFEILTLQKQFLREGVRFVIAPGQEGMFEVLPNHAPFVFALKPGALRMQMPDRGDRYVAVAGGFRALQKDRATVLTRRAEGPGATEVAPAAPARARPE